LETPRNDVKIKYRNAIGSRIGYLFPPIENVRQLNETCDKPMFISSLPFSPEKKVIESTARDGNHY
jgi:hypothetical protein